LFLARLHPHTKRPVGSILKPRGCFSVRGRSLLVVSGEQSDTISSYAIDPETGALKPIGRYPAGKGANWVEIVAFD
jgi:6-phosphogluconolactonase